jgi:hypothetical protein
METVEISRSRSELPVLSELPFAAICGKFIPIGDLCSCRARSPRPLKEFTQRFPELAKAGAVLGAESVIIDAELAVFDQQLVSRFEWLRAQPIG